VTLIPVANSAGWGDDIVAIGTFLKLPSEGLYNLYVVDPSEKNILAYSADRDGSGFHSNAQHRLAVERDVSKITQLLIDGDIFAADGGAIERFVGGKSEGWSTQAPGTASFAPDGDTVLRQPPSYVWIASATDKRTGMLYAWDRVSGRVVAFDKAKGTFVEQYRLAGGSDAWKDVRGMYVVLGQQPGDPATLVWATKDGVMSAVLEAVPDPIAGSSASPGPSGESGSAGPSPKASTKATHKPTKAP
jgi:hypothetical protein